MQSLDSELTDLINQDHHDDDDEEAVFGAERSHQPE